MAAITIPVMLFCPNSQAGLYNETIYNLPPTTIVANFLAAAVQGRPSQYEVYRVTKLPTGSDIDNISIMETFAKAGFKLEHQERIRTLGSFDIKSSEYGLIFIVVTLVDLLHLAIAKGPSPSDIGKKKTEYLDQQRSESTFFFGGEQLEGVTRNSLPVRFLYTGFMDAHVAFNRLDTNSDAELWTLVEELFGVGKVVPSLVSGMHR